VLEVIQPPYVREVVDEKKNKEKRREGGRREKCVRGGINRDRGSKE